MFSVCAVSGVCNVMKSARVEKNFEADFLDAEIEGAFGREERIVGDDPHVQANRARGDDDQTDSAAPPDAERLAGDLDAHETVLFPSIAGLGRAHE